MGGSPGAVTSPRTAASFSNPQGQEKSPFLQQQSPLSPLQYIHSLIHPEPQPSHTFLSKPNLPLWQPVFPALPYTLSSATDRMAVSQLFGDVSLWLPSPPLPSPAAPTSLFPSSSPAKSPTGDKNQPNRFFPQKQGFFVLNPLETITESS